jgi:hypothetical protein
MKTTIEISDPLLRAARKRAAREGVSLRALVERGLRRVISETRLAAFKLRRASFKGRGLQADLGDAPMGACMDAGLYRARTGEPTIPHEVVEAIHKGIHPVQAWRTHRGLTLQQLAKAGQVPVDYLSEIETGKKPGSVAAYKALARALATEIDMLVAG